MDSIPKISQNASSIAERLCTLFAGNEHRHIKNFGPPVFDNDKNKWELTVRTNEGPATLALWGQHLNSRGTDKFILSVIPLLDDGTCWFACIDVDQYDVNHVDICHHIKNLKLPLLPVVSKSQGLHLFVFFKEPVKAELIIPALRIWASRLGLKKFEIFPTSSGEDRLTRAVSMPYGATWDVLPTQCALSLAVAGEIELEHCVIAIEKIRITAAELPQPQESKPQVKKIPQYLQVAIDSPGPYPFNDRSPVTASIIYALRDLGFDADEIKTTVEGRGPFVRYTEHNRNLAEDIGRLINKYDAQHPNKKAKVEICTDVVLWDPSPPPPMDWSVHEMTAAGSVTALWGDSGAYKSFILWNLIVARMFALSFAHRKVSKRCGVLVWLAEGKADYRSRCRAALKHADLEPDQPLPLIIANNKMLPLVAKESGQQLQGMIDNANDTLEKQFGLELGCIIIDTLSMAGLFEDSYKPNEIIAVNQMLASFAESRKIDTYYTDHFPKGDKNHAAGTLHKRNSVDQILVFKDNKMILDKVRYGPDKLWNPYRTVCEDDGAGNRTLAVWFGKIQQPTRETAIDTAMIFMTALQNAQQDFGQKIKESELQKLFIELHVAAQQKYGLESKSPKEMARSAFRRELKSAEEGELVKVEEGYVCEIDHPF
jgi:hypothetical protein